MYGLLQSCAPGIVRCLLPVTHFTRRRHMTHHFFRDPRTVQRLHEGPLGPYIDAFAAEMHAEGYAQQTAELQIRLVADFSHWLAKRRIPAPEITADHFPSYLRSRAR